MSISSKHSTKVVRQHLNLVAQLYPSHLGPVRIKPVGRILEISDSNTIRRKQKIPQLDTFFLGGGGVGGIAIVLTKRFVDIWAFQKYLTCSGNRRPRSDATPFRCDTSCVAGGAVSVFTPGVCYAEVIACYFASDGIFSMILAVRMIAEQASQDCQAARNANRSGAALTAESQNARTSAALNVFQGEITGETSICGPFLVKRLNFPVL